jgi:hypothetical protein
MSKRTRCSERLASGGERHAGATATPISSSASSYKRDNSAIMKKYWDKQRKLREEEVSEKEAMLLQLSELKQQNKHLTESLADCQRCCSELQSQKDGMMKELISSKAELLRAEGLPPKFHKETNRVSMLQMIGEAILFILNVIMHRTQPHSRLYAIAEVLFERQIFGNIATERVLKDVTHKYTRKNIFVPWRVLRSIDLAINGGINFSGLEALRMVEDLNKHQRGMIPCRTTIQKCANELHQVGQGLIPPRADGSIPVENL